MKHSIILWVASAIIIFIAGYTQRTTSSSYPVNGTVDLSSGEASYSFDKVFHGKGDYQVLVVGDFAGQNGVLEWREDADSSAWNLVQLESSKNELIGTIPHHQPLAKVFYRIKLNDNGKTIVLPKTSDVILQFLGFVPQQIMQFYFITLFAGLLLAVRTSLETFSDHPRIKMYTIFTLISFFSFTLIFSSVKKSCELGIIGKTKVPSLSQLFPSGPVLLFILWIVVLIFVFNFKKAKAWAMAGSILTLLIFLIGKF